jgi:hypothetical protein
MASQKGMYSFVNSWIESHLPYIALYDNSYEEVPYLFGRARIGIHTYYDSLYDEVNFIFTWLLDAVDGAGNVYPDPQLAGSDSRCLKFATKQDNFDSFVFGHPWYPTTLTNIPDVLPNLSSAWVMPDIMLRLGNLVFGYQVLTQYYPLNDSSQDIWRNKVYHFNEGPRGRFFGRFIDFALRVIGNDQFLLTKVWDNIIWNGNVKDVDYQDIQMKQQFFLDPDFVDNYKYIFFLKVQNDWQATFVDLILEQLIKRPERDFNIIIPDDMLYITTAPISGNQLPEQVLKEGDPLPTQTNPEDIAPHLPNIVWQIPDSPYISPDMFSPDNQYSQQIFRERIRDKWSMFTFRFKNHRVITTLVDEDPVLSNEALDWKYLFRSILLLYRRSFH